MSKIRLYNVSDDYINYLRKYDKKVFSSKEEDRKKERKYLGVVLQVNQLNYYVPLSSPKDSDYILKNGKKEIRKSIIPIIRIIAKDDSGNDELKGTLKFSNMIPIPNCALIDYDVQSETDEDYKILVLKEIDFILRNENTIIKHAQVIYNQKTKNYKIGYLKHTVDFKLLEQKCKEYGLSQNAILETQEQIAADKE